MERTKRALAATLLSVAVLLLASPYAAQMVAQTIYPPAGGGGPAGLTCSATTCTFTLPIELTTGDSLYLYNTADMVTNYERGSLGWTSNELILSSRGAGGTGTPRDLAFDGQNTIYFRLSGNNYWRFTGSAIFPSATDAMSSGAAAANWTGGYFSRFVQGGKSKALTDNTATAFVRLSVADDDYEGCGVIYTAYAEDTATDARQTRTGKVYAAILNNGGTEAVAYSTGDSAVAVTAGTFTCTFDGNSAAADTIDLRATCDTSLAATTTLTFEYRVDCPSIVTVTPQ